MSPALLGIVAALLTGIAIVGVLAPTLTGRRATAAGRQEDADDRRLTILRGLRDLEADRLRGALNDTDYTSLRSRMEARAVRLMRQGADPDAAAEIASALRRSRSVTDTRTSSVAEDRKHPRRTRGRAQPQRRRGDSKNGRGWLTGALIAGVVTLGAGIALAGATGTRLPGGFITGTPAAAGQADPATVLAQDPNNVEARLELAQRSLESGQVGDATKQYLAVLRVDPKNPEARTRLALLLYESGDPQNALKGLDAVLADNPTWPEALFVKGVVLLNGLHRPADAVAPLKQYLAIDPAGPYSNDVRQLLKEAEG